MAGLYHRRLLKCFVDTWFCFSSVTRREPHDAVRACISMPCPGMSLNDLQGHADITGDPKVMCVLICGLSIFLLLRAYINWIFKFCGQTIHLSFKQMIKTICPIHSLTQPGVSSLYIPYTGTQFGKAP